MSRLVPKPKTTNKKKTTAKSTANTTSGIALCAVVCPLKSSESRRRTSAHMNVRRAKSAEDITRDTEYNEWYRSLVVKRRKTKQLSTTGSLPDIVDNSIGGSTWSELCDAFRTASDDVLPKALARYVFSWAVPVPDCSVLHTTAGTPYGRYVTVMSHVRDRCSGTGLPMTVAEFENLTAGVDITMAGANGMNAMHAAVVGNNTKVVEHIAKSRPETVRMQRRGLEPLHVAVICGNIEMVNVLCKNGANINGVTFSWRPGRAATVLDIAIDKTDAPAATTIKTLGGCRACAATTLLLGKQDSIAHSAMV